MMPALLSSVYDPHMSSSAPGYHESYGEEREPSRQPLMFNGTILQDTSCTFKIPPAPASRPKLSLLEKQGHYISSTTTNFPDERLHPSQRPFAPLVPPIRVLQSNQTQRDGASQAVQGRTPPSEPQEKVGGVAVHLDYDMETMADFVTDMAQGMYSIFTSRICLADIDISRSVVHSRASHSHSFRKFVLQVLSSTRLPSSTILLGLLYMSKRMANLSRRRDFAAKGEANVHSMLIVALILGSKFLDDNTFQNRSWSEVSGLPVRSLNLMEFQWLADIKWDMHIDQDDPDGFCLWRQHWVDFNNRRADASLAKSLQQFQLDDRYSGRKLLSQRWPPIASPVMSYTGTRGNRTQYVDNSSGMWNNTVDQRSVWQRDRPELTPPSAPETGPATPDSHKLLEFGNHCGVNLPQALKSSTHPFQSYSAGTPLRYCTPQFAYRYDNFHGPCFDGCQCHIYQDIPYTACA